jgi:hypothetical protein
MPFDEPYIDAFLVEKMRTLELPDRIKLIQSVKANGTGFEIRPCSPSFVNLQRTRHRDPARTERPTNLGITRLVQLARIYSSGTLVPLLHRPEAETAAFFSMPPLLMIFGYRAGSSKKHHCGDNQSMVNQLWRVRTERWPS